VVERRESEREKGLGENEESLVKHDTCNCSPSPSFMHFHISSCRPCLSISIPRLLKLEETFFFFITFVRNIKE
jgi:hypothetical protein